MVNINKPGKVRVAFDARATYHATSLKKSLLKGLDLLKSLVEFLTRFQIGSYAFMGNIDQMFHQILVWNKDRDVCVFYGEIIISGIVDSSKNVHWFSKVDSPYIANWTIKKQQKTSHISFTNFLSKP